MTHRIGSDGVIVELDVLLLKPDIFSEYRDPCFKFFDRVGGGLDLQSERNFGGIVAVKQQVFSCLFYLLFGVEFPKPREFLGNIDRFELHRFE